MFKGRLKNGQKFRVKRYQVYSNDPLTQEALRGFASTSGHYFPTYQDAENWIGKQIIKRFGGTITQESTAPEASSPSEFPDVIY